MIIESYAIYVVLPCAMLIFTIGYYLDRSRARDERKAVLTTLTTMLQSANQLSQDVDNHTSELSDMGRTVTDLDVSKEMGSVRQSLLGHIKDIISSNNKLEDDLVCARYTLQQQSLELDKTRMEMRVDALSQVGNRKAFDEALDYWLSKWNRHGERFALVICDIDHFKWINDTHGHRAGDDVVRGVGSLLKRVSTTTRVHSWRDMVGTNSLYCSRVSILSTPSIWQKTFILRPKHTFSAARHGEQSRHHVQYGFGLRLERRLG